VGVWQRKARCAVYGEAWRRSLNLWDPNVHYRSGQFIEGWKNLAPEQSKDPCLYPVALLLMDDQLSPNNEIDLEAAQCIVVQFDVYTRPNTAVDLSTFNVIERPGGSNDKYRQVTLLLAPREQGKTTKTGRVDDSLLLGTVNPNRRLAATLALQLKANAV